MTQLQGASFDELRDWLSVATSEPDIQNALGRFATRNGFEWFTYLSLSQSTIRGVSNYPRDWKHHYLAEHLALVDPIIVRSRQSSTAFAWSKGESPKGLTKKQVRFMRDAATVGIRSGVSIPVNGGFGTRGTITFSSSDDRPNMDFVVDQFSLLAIGAFLHAYLPHSESVMFQAPKCPLTLVQLETLSWLVQGKTSSEIAQIRSVSDRAIEYQLHTIRNKLGTNTTVQSVAVALERHWISL